MLYSAGMLKEPFLSLLYGAYYLPPYGSLRLAASYQMMFALFTGGSLQIFLGRKRLKHTITALNLKLSHGPWRYASSTTTTPDSIAKRQHLIYRPSRRRILFIDHTALLSGGELALLNLIVSLDIVTIEAEFSERGHSQRDPI